VIILAALCALSLSFLLFQPERGNVHADNRSRRAGTSVPKPSAFSTIVGEVRTIVLEDGSRIILDTDSLLSVDFSSTERRLRLIRGRARFEVAHERRPFRVGAGAGVITARGTIFDVRVGPDRAISVHLLRGAIDVATKAGPTHTELLSQVQHLRPGQGTSYTDRFATAQPIARLSDTRWPSTRAEFDDVSLGEVIIEANRYSLVPIEVEDEHLAKLKVSGVFSLRDTQNVAEKLAHLFNLEVSREPYRILLSKPGGSSHE
jgi:transmembrane sensor